MHKLYSYIGPRDIAERCAKAPAGRPVEKPEDVLQWIEQTGQEPDGSGQFIATFVVDQTGVLRIADRHSEHVACAGGQPVQSAGEMCFLISGDEVAVDWVTNQSTGYCPEPDSWPAVKAALEKAAIEPPDGFGPEFVFRRCLQCQTLNIIKDGVFECGVCSGSLPADWNAGPIIHDDDWSADEMSALAAQMFDLLDDAEEIR